VRSSTDTKSPYCNTASFSGNIFDYWCNDIAISTPQAADTTFKGQSNPRTFEPLVLGDTTTQGGLGFTINTSDEASATDPPPEVDTDGDNDNDNGNTGGGGGGKKKKSNTGAIAGGVVGGVAAIGLLGAGAFLLRKKNKQDKTTSNVPPTVATTATTFPPTSPMAQSAYGPSGMAPQQQPMYDPNYNQQVQQGQFGTVPPGGVYQQKPEYGGYYGQQQQGMMAPPVDRNGSTSPMSDGNRLSNVTGVSGAPLQSPTPSQVSNFAQQQQAYAPGQPHPQQFQQTQPTIHEAGGNQVDHHRGQMHELG
jgi:hypothetical protein